MGGCDIAREERHAYLDLAGDGRVDEAVHLCLDLYDRGVAPEAIALRLLRPAQCEVGRRWSLGTGTVAQEHAVSAAADAALAALSAAAPARTRGDPVVVACPRTEWHGLAARMVTQLLRWRGVAAEFVGTLASDAALAQLVDDRRPRALALSCTMTSALPEVARAVVVAARLIHDELGADDVELVRDAAEQVVAVALAAARTGHGSILADGVAELSASLGRRPSPVSAVAARLPGVVHAELG